MFYKLVSTIGGVFSCEDFEWKNEIRNFLFHCLFGVRERKSCLVIISILLIFLNHSNQQFPSKFLRLPYSINNPINNHSPDVCLHSDHQQYLIEESNFPMGIRYPTSHHPKSLTPNTSQFYNSLDESVQVISSTVKVLGKNLHRHVQEDRNGYESVCGGPGGEDFEIEMI